MTVQPIPGPAAAIQAQHDRLEWQRIAAKREADHAAIAGDNPHAEININKRNAAK